MMTKKDLLSVSDLSKEEIDSLIERALYLKAHKNKPFLKGKVLALLFEKPSLRTKVSFSVAIFQLGGNYIFLPKEEIGIGTREDAPDIARVLSRYVDCLVYRTFSHEILKKLAVYSSIPVINGLSDLEHPCQALADILTIYEIKRQLKGIKVAYVGDGNNVAHSLALAAALTGMDFVIASPQGYEMNSEIVEEIKTCCRESGSRIFVEKDPLKAVKKADIIYTDVWTSMGQETETEKRRRDFSGFQINNSLLSAAPDKALVMHPLPAHYGEEILKEVLEGPQSIVYEQAENRLHMQKAILLHLLLNKKVA